MKKTILATLAIASMMSCSNEELIDSPAQQAIAFDNTFVDKAPISRAAYDGSYTTGSLTQFQVYATVTNKNGVSGRVFTGDVVSYDKAADKWTYTCPTQYWVPGNDYHFWAIADGNAAGATSVTTTNLYVPTAINLLDASQQKDVLLATRTYADYQTTDGTTVAFTLRHLMAKAKFTVKNNIDTNSGYSYKVKDITIIGTGKNGVYSVANKTWAPAAEAETYDLSFGHAVAQGTAAGDATAVAIGFNEKAESNFDRLLLPSAKQLTVRFKCELFKDGVLIHTEEAKQVTTEKVIELVQGRAYNFIISLSNPGEKIQFTVEKINDWKTQPDVEI